jgi:primosomal protein N'
LVTFSIFSLAITSFQAYSVEEIWEDYENMEDMVKDIRNGGKDDDKVDYDKFKDSSVYMNEDEDTRNCIDLANKVGQKLGDYEIVRCFENTNYFREKYTDTEGTKNMEEVNLQEQNKQEQAEQDNQNQTLSEAMANTSQQQQDELEQEQQEQEQQEQEQQEQEQQEQEQQEQEQQELDNKNQTLSEAKANTTQQQQQDEQEQGQPELDNKNQTLNEAQEGSGQTQGSQSDSNPQEGCDSSYPEICLTIYSAKLSCGDIPFRNFKVLLPDPHGFDSDGDGIGCEG